MTRPSTEGARITTTLFLRDVEHVATGYYLPAIPGDADGPAEIQDVAVHALDGTVLELSQDELDQAERALSEEADGR